MTIPAEALARVDARLRSLKPGEVVKVELTLDAVRHADGKLRVVAHTNLGEKDTLVVQLPLDTPPS